jgi:predicted nucleic acid-binding protein
VILYLGTSSLVKLYVREAHSDLVREWLRDAEIAATCRVAYTEAMSAFDVRRKNGDLTVRDYEALVKGLTRDWQRYAVLDFDEIDASRLLKRHGLRRLDAMHLSAAKRIATGFGGVSLCFSSFDSRLCDAAAAEGLRVLTCCALPPSGGRRPAGADRR